MVITDNLGDLFVVGNVPEDFLTSDGMALHLTTLFERQGAWLFKKTSWQTDLADVVDEPTEVNQFALAFGQIHPPSDVARIDGNGRRMASGVAVSRIERGDK